MSKPVKKIYFLLFWCFNASLLFAQNIDSLNMQEELRQLRRASDSLTRAQIARDSLRIENGVVSLPLDPNAEEELPTEKEANYERMLKLQEEEQHSFRNKLLLLSAGVLVLMIGMRTILNKQKKKRPVAKKDNPQQ